MTFEEEKEIIKSAVDKSNNFTELIENIIKESYMKGIENKKSSQKNLAAGKHLDDTLM